MVSGKWVVPPAWFAFASFLFLYLGTLPPPLGTPRASGIIPTTAATAAAAAAAAGIRQQQAHRHAKDDNK